LDLLLERLPVRQVGIRRDGRQAAGRQGNLEAKVALPAVTVPDIVEPVEPAALEVPPVSWLSMAPTS
jgi:hypothetical protein